MKKLVISIILHNCQNPLPVVNWLRDNLHYFSQHCLWLQFFLFHNLPSKWVLTLSPMSSFHFLWGIWFMCPSLEALAMDQTLWCYAAVGDWEVCLLDLHHLWTPVGGCSKTTFTGKASLTLWQTTRSSDFTSIHSAVCALNWSQCHNPTVVFYHAMVPFNPLSLQNYNV